MNYFLTGATGTLGTEVVSELLSVREGTVYVLVRASSDAEAAMRLRSLWWELPGLLSVVGDRIVPVAGDITLPGLGLAADRSSVLRREVAYVIHCAAETGIQNSKETLRRINVEGTRNVVDFAASMEGIKRFVHVSTAYVAGCGSGRIMPEDPLPDVFNSQYEWSKAESQTLHSSTLPANMYVADASILPESPGLPPILTIMALAKRISKLIKA